MSTTLSAITLFCEDIREERNNTDTLVGVFGDNIEMPNTASALPKLALYSRVIVSVNELDIEPIRLVLRVFGKEVELALFEPDFIRKTITDVRALGAPIAGFVSRATLAPFPVLEPGRIVVVATTPTSEKIIGNLNFMRQAENNDPIALPPSPQSPSAAS
jgi:hypothetical protein